MGLIADAVRNDGVTDTGCMMGEFIKTLEAEDRNDVITIMLEGEATMTALHRAINAKPFNAKVGYSTVRRHRDRSCRCGDDVWELA